MPIASEPVWRSVKALLGWYAEEPRFESASALSSKVCGLWSLSCDVVPHN